MSGRLPFSRKEHMMRRFSGRPIRRPITALTVALAAVALGACGGDDESASTPAPASDAAATEIPTTSVRFAHEPYFDHTQASIGLEKGWFKDVGITIEPDGKGVVPQADQVAGFIASDRVDVASGSAQLLMPSVGKLPPVKLFTLADLFKGYALMGPENAQTYQKLVAGGADPETALKQAVEQMRGKRFCFPSEAAIKGFIMQVVRVGGLKLDDMDTTVAPDSQTTSLMQGNRCDFQVGGVPSRLTLQLAGFKPVVTSGDLAENAKPSADSAELQAVFNDGWVATDEWLDGNAETALRLLSVSLRINQFIHDDPKAASEIHTKFLNSVAGTDFPVDLAPKVVYPSLDPFLTFAQQQKTCTDDGDPLNPKYLIGSSIKLYESQGVFKPGQYAVEDFSRACELVARMADLKREATAALKQLDGSSSQLAQQAQAQFDAFNYLDALKLAKGAAEGS
jgi:ABC-type nitrate/sulfonate/bicarbonate transport system substrate-binding protein